ncbi:MAG: acetate--CoA ligase [Alcanivorax sp.]|jgi:acetyl-CoA synthetase|uniref:acetate--CoA ligase n=1 Tax=Alcanivorax TaxID=59753 RepID=UPI000C655E52|nr:MULTISPECIES: acetate--CoA ligase [Alcanivorax]MAC16409.1 acetate--CoA ligase [Alcanivorax sp.]MBG33586.1 acetate--CoA ligase [Alcanivorax sp.]MDF1637989.1 acetate--CoA ligase [Alcanivorax jadensis]|tara:strand:- start:79174 stop:81111 length:1938 start_codon:yes stop_codon:yes gene_type:complete
MSKTHIHPVPADFKAQTLMDRDTYEKWYEQSINDPDTFWADRAREFLDWKTPWDTVSDWDFNEGRATWFQGATLNVCYNCVDRHLPERANQTAIIWEGDEPDQDKHISYQQLFEEVSKFGNVLKSRGVKKGDRVVIYMPMIPEAAYAMLACARIGAIHSVVFGGFSPEALKDRIQDAGACAVITADEGVRGGKAIPLKVNADKAMASTDSVHTCLTVQRTGGDIDWQADRDVWYHEAMAEASSDCEPEWVDAEDPLFTLYTSGSTGKPKGVVHTTAGYLLNTALTHKYVFDYHEGDIYWCTADVGWITGHSYIVYGPLANGATTLMFEGVPTYPDASRCWQVVDKHKVNIFYTAPTAIRALMGLGDEPVTKTSRASLKLLGTVGEPINPEAWEWYYKVVGESRCPIVDTWWQTETGAIMIAPLPGAVDLKAGSATLPMFGVQPVLMDPDGNELDGATSGNLAIKASWPSQIRTVYGDHQRLIDTYFSAYKGYYFTGDGARRDEDGYYWITGRVDDVLNVSGHRLGTAEIESALVLHTSISEAAVVGYQHDVKGQGIYAYVSLMAGKEGSDELVQELRDMVTQEIGPIAKPDLIHFAPGLPKTRSGKIMRRILRKIAANELDSLGDTSTLADPAVVDQLIDTRLNQ